MFKIVGEVVQSMPCAPDCQFGLACTGEVLNGQPFCLAQLAALVAQLETKEGISQVRAAVRSNGLSVFYTENNLPAEYQIQRGVVTRS